MRACVIGPDEANIAAIRAYEKARFRFIETICVPGGPDPEHPMRRERAQLDGDSGRR